MDLIQKVLLQEHYFKSKVCEAMKSGELRKMNDSVQVDEFTIGGGTHPDTYIELLVDGKSVLQTRSLYETETL